MIAAVVVMLPAAVAAEIPYTAHSFSVRGFLRLSSSRKTLLNFLAILPFSCHIYLHGLIDQIILGGHDVRDVSQGVDVVRRGIQIDRDTSGLIHQHYGLSQLTHKLLYGFESS